MTRASAPDPIVDRVTELQKANPDFTIGSFGESTDKAVFAAFMDDLHEGRSHSIPADADHPLNAFGALSLQQASPCCSATRRC